MVKWDYLTKSKEYRIAERSSSVGRVLDWGFDGLLVRDSPLSFCCVLEQDTLSPA